MIKSIMQISETSVKRKKKLDIEISGIFLFVYTVYILHGLFYIQQSLSPSPKLNYQEFCVKKKKLNLNMSIDLKQPLN